MFDYQSVIKSALNENKKIQASSSFISLWYKWYKGKVPSFHSYKIWNGQKNVKMQKRSLKMAKKVCEDWASLLMNEKVQIVVSKQDLLDKLLMDMDFYTKANKAVEYGFALSMSALVLSVENLNIVEDENGNSIYQPSGNEHLAITTYSALKIVPITYKNGVCIECAFIVENTNDTTVSVHRLNDKGNYEIVVFKKKNNPTSNDDKVESTIIFDTQSNVPWFVLISPNIVNNLDVDSPLPISIFANAVDELMYVDDVFDSYDQEYIQGKRRTYVSSEMNEVDKLTGEIVNRFDPNDTVIYNIPKQTTLNGDAKPLILVSAEALRANDHTIGMKDALNLLSAKCGLGVDYYNFEKGRVMTATQVISEKSDTFRNLKKHECILEKALHTFIRAIMVAYNQFIENGFDKPDEVQINFDDSIIEDKATEKANDQKEVEMGVMSKLEFRMKWHGEDEDTAMKALKKIGTPDQATRIAQYIQAFVSGAMTAQQFVDLVYPDAENKDEIAQKLEEQKSSSDSISEQDVLGMYQPSRNPNANL